MPFGSGLSIRHEMTLTVVIFRWLTRAALRRGSCRLSTLHEITFATAPWRRRIEIAYPVFQAPRSPNRMRQAI